MEENEEENIIIKERDFIIKSDKKNEYKIKLFITNNELFYINFYNTSIFPSKKIFSFFNFE